MIYDRSIWDEVKSHAWKWAARMRPPTGIIWHSTRSGRTWTTQQEMASAENWFKSAGNRTSHFSFSYAAISNYLVGNEIVEVVPETKMPRYSSWPADRSCISIEVCQANKGDIYPDVVIANCVALASYLEVKYNIPRQRVEDQEVIRGHIGHEDTIQGKYQGKSDPDAGFWNQFWPIFIGEDDMAGIDELRLQVVDLQKQVEALKRDDYASSLRRDIHELANGPWKLVEPAHSLLAANGFLRVGDSESR